MSLAKHETYANSIVICDDFRDIVFDRNPVGFMGNVEDIYFLCNANLFDIEHYPLLF